MRNGHIQAASLPDFEDTNRSAHPGPLTDYPPALVEVTLERVIASSTFRRSQRHRQFLIHVVRAGLAGRHDQLKEVIIGLEVFGRALPLYDPRRDPIVRVEAGRIREKLARFYGGEGAHESFEIVIPVGSYLPRFARRRTVAPIARVRSVAVLPFTALGGDPRDVDFSLGLADQLIDTLGRLPGVKVVARLSGSHARDARTDLRAVGKLLAVDHVIEGSVQRSGARLRCIAHLAQTRDGTRIWSQRFDHGDGEPATDVFDFQDGIADAVLAAVAGLGSVAAIDPQTGRPSTTRIRNTDDRDARDLFERARTLTRSRSLEGYEEAIALLKRAVAIDPAFGRAYSHLGSARANLAAFRVEPSRPGFDEVRQSASRALELDPLDGEARALLATVAHRIDRDWAAAEPMYHEALRLAPNSVMTHTSFAWSLAFTGRFEEAMQHTRLARDLDPLNIGLRANNAAIAKFARRYDVAVAEFEAVLAVDARHLFSHTMLGVTCLVTGALDRAMGHFESASRLAPSHPSPRFCKICVHGLRGDTELGAQALRALLADLGEQHYSRFNLATAQSCLGDAESTFASLEHAARVRDVLYVSVPAHGLFERFRNDPRYLDLLARTGLPLLPPPVAVVRGSA